MTDSARNIPCSTSPAAGYGQGRSRSTWANKIRGSKGSDLGAERHHERRRLSAPLSPLTSVISYPISFIPSRTKLSRKALRKHPVRHLRNRGDYRLKFTHHAGLERAILHDDGDTPTVPSCRRMRSGGHRRPSFAEGLQETVLDAVAACNDGRIPRSGVWNSR